MTALTRHSDLPGLNAANIANIANGQNAPAVMPVRSGSIQAAHHWIVMPQMPADQALAHVQSYIRVAYGIYGSQAVTEENVVRGNNQVLPVNPANNNGLAASVTFAAASAALRKKAIVLGTMRAAMTQIWGLANGNMTQDEMITPANITYNPAAGATRVDCANANDAIGQTLIERLARAMADLTPVEMEVVYQLIRLSMAAVPLAGLTLLQEGHHYLDRHSTAHKAVLKQIKNDTTADAAAWMSDPAFLDLVWHKSVHPIDIVFLKNQANSQTVPGKLRDAGIGAAAVRLPYCEGQMKAARAMVAVVAAVSAYVADAGGVISVQTIIDAITTVEMFQVGAAALANPPDPAHANIMTRQAAITGVLEPSMQRCAAAVAFAVGVYDSIMEDLGRQKPPRLVTDAYSLKKLRQTQVHGIITGQEFYSAVSRDKRNRADGGEIPTPNLNF